MTNPSKSRKASAPDTVTDALTDTAPDPDAERKLARLRFLVIGLFRLIGALLVLVGFAVISGGISLSGTPQDRVIGVILVLFGLFEFAIMPLILARRWRTPRA